MSDKQTLHNPKNLYTVKVIGGDRYYIGEKEATELKRLQMLDEDVRPEIVVIMGDTVRMERIAQVIDCSRDRELIDEI